MANQAYAVLKQFLKRLQLSTIKVLLWSIKFLLSTCAVMKNCIRNQGIRPGSKTSKCASNRFSLHLQELKMYLMCMCALCGHFSNSDTYIWVVYVKAFRYEWTWKKHVFWWAYIMCSKFSHHSMFNKNTIRRASMFLWNGRISSFWDSIPVLELNKWRSLWFTIYI